jgi:mannose-1-phosphate guanylyltransferase
MSTPSRPKQLLPLAGPDPLIADAVRRAELMAPRRRIRILAGAHLVEPFRGVLPALPDDAYMVEPEARGTAPVLAWAAWTIVQQDPDAVLVSLHADHRVEPASAFADLLQAGAELAARDEMLVTVGATPDRPETGYGYIQPGAPLEGPPAGAARVAAFHEKPDADTAARYLHTGYLWNTGIFIWRAETFLQEVEAHAPEVSRALPRLEAGDVTGFFRDCEPVSVDVAVLERSSRVAVIPCSFAWDDVGSWDALPRVRRPDSAGNLSLGPSFALESRGNVTFTDGPPVVLFGVDDLVVVRTGGATLVTRRELASDLKRLVDALPPDLIDPEA